MKWAPNKKLHFDVAIIKAIQSLGQATLDDVIQRLGDLRGGKAVAGIGDAGGKEQPLYGKAAGITDPGYNKEKASRVAESEPEYGAKRANLNPAELWKQVSAKIPPQKAFLRNAAAAAHVLGMDGRNLQLGFAPADKSLMEIMGTQANRKFVETLLHEISNKDFAIKLALDETVPARPVSPAFAESPADKPPPAAEFENNPLIQEAIEMFEGKIKS